MKTKLRILFVEDLPDDAVLVTHQLQEANYDVSYECVDTEPTLRQALAWKNWDVVLCDYTMPRFSGAAALQVVREIDADLPFIYVSGTIGEDVAVEAMKSGANDYVMKNNLKRLPNAMERALQESESQKRRRTMEWDRDQLIAKLEAALRNLEGLSGTLSLCSDCKRIRSRDGVWQSIEHYIQMHTDVHFVRGMCPDCRATRERFPDWDSPLSE